VSLLFYKDLLFLPLTNPIIEDLVVPEEIFGLLGVGYDCS